MMLAAFPVNHVSSISSKTGWKQAGDILKNDKIAARRALGWSGQAAQNHRRFPVRGICRTPPVKNLEIQANLTVPAARHRPPKNNQVAQNVTLNCNFQSDEAAANLVSFSGN